MEESYCDHFTSRKNKAINDTTTIDTTTSIPTTTYNTSNLLAKSHEGFYSIRKKAVNAFLQSNNNNTALSDFNFDEYLYSLSAKHSLTPRFPVKTDVVNGLATYALFSTNLAANVKLFCDEYHYLTVNSSSTDHYYIAHQHQQSKQHNQPSIVLRRLKDENEFWKIFALWIAVFPLLNSLIYLMNISKYLPKQQHRICHGLDYILGAAMFICCLGMLQITSIYMYISFLVPFLLLRYIEHTEHCVNDHLKLTQSSTEHNYRHRCYFNSASSWKANKTMILLESRLLIEDFLKRINAASIYCLLKFTCWPIILLAISFCPNKHDENDLVCEKNSYMNMQRSLDNILSMFIKTNMISAFTTFLYYLSEIVNLDILIALQKNCEHLGCWRPIRLDFRRKTDFKQWHDLNSDESACIIITKGTIVMHDDQVYIAVGSINCATPGNLVDKLIYKVFRRPCRIVEASLICNLIILAFLIYRLQYSKTYQIMCIQSVQVATCMFSVYNAVLKSMVLRGFAKV